MTGDCHVRFCERLRGETPLCLLGANNDLLSAVGTTHYRCSISHPLGSTTGKLLLVTKTPFFPIKSF